jgi:RHS repeat-associated protein
VVYTHALGLDHPVTVIKDGVAVMPHLNWNGQYDVGMLADGSSTRSCSGGPTCPIIEWSGGARSTDGENLDPHTVTTWFGDLISNKSDGSGLMYMRNRYYDPKTGRFTQEDPIGLAGGMNLYGFAGGDPVNYSDPFGLCKNAKGEDVPCPDKDKVVKWMQDNAGSKPTGKCAHVCRLGLDEGGFDSGGQQPIAAGDYGPFLLGRGAGEVPEGKAAEAGDIAVFDKTATHKYGHIQIFDGKQWLSDFKQKGFIPYRDKASAGAHTLYRFPGTLPPIVVHPDTP